MEKQIVPLPIVIKNSLSVATFGCSEMRTSVSISDIMKEDEWFVASCPPLDIATQGETEEKVKENMNDLIDEYLQNPDTQTQNNLNH